MAVLQQRAKETVTYLQIYVAILISSQAGILKTAVGHSSSQHTAPSRLHDGIYLGRRTGNQSKISTYILNLSCASVLIVWEKSPPTATYISSKYI